MLQSDLLSQTIELSGALHILFLNSAAHPLVVQVAQQLRTATITLAEDNVVTLSVPGLRHVPYHKYTLREPPCIVGPPLAGGQSGGLAEPAARSHRFSERLWGHTLVGVWQQQPRSTN